MSKPRWTSKRPGMGLGDAEALAALLQIAALVGAEVFCLHECWQMLASLEPLTLEQLTRMIAGG